MTTIPPRHAWTLARLLGGQDAGVEAEGLPPGLDRLYSHLASLEPEARMAAWPTIQATHPAGESLAQAVFNLDPSGPPPADEAGGVVGPACATLADVRRGISETRWIWTGWIPAGRLLCLASDPGIGKTRTILDLARRVHRGLPWPDGQPMTLPAGSVTLWVAGDRQHDELAEVAAAYGLPDEAVLFNTAPDDPYGGLDLDDPETMADLGERVRSVAPAFAVIDTVGMTTGRNLCRPEEARAYLGPLADLATTTGVPVLTLTHLSKEKEALGRRIIGTARIVWNMTQPDPEGLPDRRRLWVSKSYAIKPPALGVTMGEAGNDYDFEPPSEPEPVPRKRGPAPAKLEACKAWLAERLITPSRVTDIRNDAEAAGFSSGTLYATRDALGADEYVLDRRKWWKLPAADPSQEGDCDEERSLDEIDFGEAPTPSTRLSELSDTPGPADNPDNPDSPAGIAGAPPPSPPASASGLSELSDPHGNSDTPTADNSPEVMSGSAGGGRQ